ncbi:hypothetical protein DSO57_1025459 [Entomophthora muscae]|uniref:Uncharacterized protein n=1 Tax=Entomophthora muscae TaxID=34485 RepID=A0ACC2UCT5_9FUNG|nr:hypothetical protein DSO57_1025459 [Entomophthora muscae]
MHWRSAVRELHPPAQRHVFLLPPRQEARAKEKDVEYRHLPRLSTELQRDPSQLTACCWPSPN